MMLRSRLEKKLDPKTSRPEESGKHHTRSSGDYYERARRYSKDSERYSSRSGRRSWSIRKADDSPKSHRKIPNAQIREDSLKRKKTKQDSRKENYGSKSSRITSKCHRSRVSEESSDVPGRREKKKIRSRSRARSITNELRARTKKHNTKDSLPKSSRRQSSVEKERSNKVKAASEKSMLQDKSNSRSGAPSLSASSSASSGISNPGRNAATTGQTSYIEPHEERRVLVSSSPKKNPDEPKKQVTSIGVCEQDVQVDKKQRLEKIKKLIRLKKSEAANIRAKDEGEIANMLISGKLPSESQPVISKDSLLEKENPSSLQQTKGYQCPNGELPESGRSENIVTESSPLEGQNSTNCEVSKNNVSSTEENLIKKSSFPSNESAPTDISETPPDLSNSEFQENNKLKPPLENTSSANAAEVFEEPCSLKCMDSLDLFMAAIDHEVEELSNTTKKKGKKRRKRAANVEKKLPTSQIGDVVSPKGPIMPKCITLEEILELQKQDIIRLQRNTNSEKANSGKDTKAQEDSQLYNSLEEQVAQVRDAVVNLHQKKSSVIFNQTSTEASNLFTSNEEMGNCVKTFASSAETALLSSLPTELVEDVAPVYINTNKEEGVGDLPSNTVYTTSSVTHIDSALEVKDSPLHSLDRFNNSTTANAESLTERHESGNVRPVKMDEEKNDESYHLEFMAMINSKRTKHRDGSKSPSTNAPAHQFRELEESISLHTEPGDDAVDTTREDSIDDTDEQDYRYNVIDNDAYQSYFDLVQKVGNKKDLPPINHAKMDYPPFRKNLYVQVREISLMKDHEIDAFRKLQGGIKVRGKLCPRPIRTFYQCGLPDAILKVIEKRAYLEPFPIQMQAIPALMAGRDVIGIAETGSGKTLAYLFPAIRHVLDQPPLRNLDGPIVLILAPTRELVVQIQREAHKFTKVVSLTSIAVYGGVGIGEQLSALKRGAEIVVATPGRLIDVLTINSGKVTNLRRVTFCVLDEADRMFDLGFEPQITSILKSIRPDRQTAFFSATFPLHIENLAKKILKKPLEITVGEKGKTASRVEQFVEIWSSYKEKFLRLLQLLGEWNEHGSIIIFVSRQNQADELFAELLKYGYPSLVLHGGQDQTDRDFTIHDFKEGSRSILIATSVAARGLDVKSVILVINFVAPDHLEDYVHRVGRTGRAGNIGVAYTFLTPEESDKAEDLIKALKQNGKPISSVLQDLADNFKMQCTMGLAKQRKSKGFGGKGFKFTDAEKSRQQQERQRAKKEMGMNESEEDEEESFATDDDLENPMSPIQLPLTQSFLAGTESAAILAGTGDDVDSASARAKALAELVVKQQCATGISMNMNPMAVDPMNVNSVNILGIPPPPNNLMDQKTRQVLALRNSLQQQINPSIAPSTAQTSPATIVQKNLAQALALAASNPALAPLGTGVTIGNVPGLSCLAYIDPATGNSVEEFDINDYPQYARFKITHKDVLHRISDQCGAVLQVKGRYVPPEERDSLAMFGAKRLYIEIIGSTPIVVQRAKHEIRTLLESISVKQLNFSGNLKSTGRYCVV